MKTASHLSQTEKTHDQMEVTKSFENAATRNKHGEAYCRKLCRAFVESGIPLNKLQEPSLRSFLKELTGHDQPSESLIRKFYVDKEYESEMEAMKTRLENSLIWISLDETPDASGRSIHQ